MVFFVYRAGILVTLWLSLSQLFAHANAPGNQFHPYLTIVLGTSAIFLVGFLVSIVPGKKETGPETKQGKT